MLTGARLDQQLGLEVARGLRRAALIRRARDGS